MSILLPSACVHDYGGSSASAALHYDVRCWYTNITQRVHVRRKLYGRGCLLPTPAWAQRVLQLRTRLRDASDWLLTEQAHGGVRQV